MSYSDIPHKVVIFSQYSRTRATLLSGLQNQALALEVLQAKDIRDLEQINAGTICVVLDIADEKASSEEAQKFIRHHSPRWSVVFVETRPPSSIILKAIRSDTIIFIDEDYTAKRLAHCIREALGLDSACGTAARRDDVLKRVDLLSRRERQVLSGLVHGKTNKIIAREIDISPRTVEKYRARIMEKMAAESYPQLLRMAFTAGWSLLGDG